MNNPQIQTIFEGKEDHAKVRQDKSVPLGNRPASEQAYRPSDELQSNRKPVQSGDHQTYTGSTQDQHTHPKEHLVPLTTQIPVFIKAEIQRSARQENLSTSAAAAALLSRAVQGQVDMQYGAMLRPVIEDSVKKEIHACIDRTNQLSMNAFLAGDQGRILIIHVLSSLLNGGGDVLPQLVKDSQKQSWANLRYLMGEKGESN